MRIRPIEQADYAGWRPLWDGYNAFYGRAGDTALDEAITCQTWERFFVASDPVKAFVAELDGQIVGLVHLVYHPSTTRQCDVCYLQDLFTSPMARGRGVGRRLIERVYAEAQSKGCSRVYWTTFEDNRTARALYDQVAQYNGAIMYVQEIAS
ncbi:GNAT family N-acetyltransferase [Hydrogenophaga pseudoflava]|uniref:GNAT family N-acetyltransferase n=1 Tax=Hydrogenophaga pseudoflava TaxID=47421 RepID=UPI0008250CE3|nr:GNAT family N-acetyltransferase [Hydrogenophaga pseudoflava]